MTLLIDPVVGSTRVVVLTADPAMVRGALSEFRHFGLSIVLRDDILAALTELIHDPSARLVVHADIPRETLRSVLELAIAACGTSVILGMTATTDVAAVGIALTAGVHTTVDLPLSAERLARAVRALPAVAAETAPMTVGNLTVDAARHRLEWAGRNIECTPREFDVMLELARRHPGVATLDELARGSHASAADPFAAVRVVITHIRARIAEISGPSGAAIIQTVRGVGYRLEG